MSSDFTSPDSKRILLSGDRWVEVKTELTYGEEKTLQGFAIYAARMGQDDAGPEYARWFLKRMSTWIIDWNLQDSGKPIELSEPAIQALKPSVAAEIEEAINQHIEDMGKKDGSASRTTDSPAATMKKKTTTKKSTTEK